MCGIVGYWTPEHSAKAHVAERMARQIEARGPDGAGTWIDEHNGLSLAHRRLSILDLSSAGHQPMVSPCGRYVLVYNGEIYNHSDLRKVLEAEGGHFNWRGHSDTETLLAALRHWGIQGTLERINGMFAFALWDAAERILFLARDRMGIKPLYYGRNGDTFLFGSELKALTAHPDWQGEVDRDALALYMRNNYVPAPWSIYKGINKLPPAHFVPITNGGHDVGEAVCYWDLVQVAEQGVASPPEEPGGLAEKLDVLLRDAVGRRMVADVPLGAFLSGGYDSTTVAALMQAQSESPVKTFSIGFHEEGHNEAKHAKAVAEHLGTDHTELYITPEEAMGVIPKLPSIYDEPFSDSSQIPTYLVSQLARQHVTVSLSGDGGDELFYGYGRYFKGQQFERIFRILPMPFRKILSSCLRHIPVSIFNRLGQKMPGPLQIQALGLRLHNLSKIMNMPNAEAVYHWLTSHWKFPADLVLGSTEPATLMTKRSHWPTLPGLPERMMFFDSMTYLPDDILTKVDRASMAVSLEARVPLLDHRVVEFAWQVPTEYKYYNGQGKWLLRQVLYRYVPRELVERPKMGFGVPIEHWLRGPLREWAEDLVNEKRLREEGFFDPNPIRKMWREHILGKQKWHYYLWDILMFQAWLDEHVV